MSDTQTPGGVNSTDALKAWRAEQIASHADPAPEPSPVDTRRVAPSSRTAPAKKAAAKKAPAKKAPAKKAAAKVVR